VIEGDDDVGVRVLDPHASWPQVHVDLAAFVCAAAMAIRVREPKEHATDPLPETTQRKAEPAFHLGATGLWSARRCALESESSSCPPSCETEPRMALAHRFFYALGHHSTIRKFQRESSQKTVIARPDDAQIPSQRADSEGVRCLWFARTCATGIHSGFTSSTAASLLHASTRSDVDAGVRFGPTFPPRSPSREPGDPPTGQEVMAHQAASGKAGPKPMMDGQRKSDGLEVAVLAQMS